ncbi:hypothetical protein B0H16DRAFT_389625 [Mycena metata]|uniref:Uncharacterized protein n=1 Tax=Mycena metata TaxID=1033252 RepID=A0AAD7HGM6_9AGAR|nr:hypothetical protein B0H16DRAFT_389625 [Mycena metata]
MHSRTRPRTIGVRMHLHCAHVARSAPALTVAPKPPSRASRCCSTYAATDSSSTRVCVHLLVGAATGSRPPRSLSPHPPTTNTPRARHTSSSPRTRTRKRSPHRLPRLKHTARAPTARTAPSPARRTSSSRASTTTPHISTTTALPSPTPPRFDSTHRRPDTSSSPHAPTRFTRPTGSARIPLATARADTNITKKSANHRRRKNEAPAHT